MNLADGQILRVAHVGPPRSSRELDLAYDIFARGFPPSYFEARAYFEFLRANEPPVPAENLRLAWAADGTLAGAIRMADRTMLVDRVPMSVAGLSFYAIATEYQSGDCGLRLIESLFDLIDTRGYDLSAGVARKIMDGYWSRFDFIGFGTFHTITISPKVLRIVGASSGVDLRTVGPKQQVAVGEFHAESYAMVSGALVRDATFWKWWNSRRLRRRDLSLSVFESATGPIGYVVQKGSVVIEMGGQTSTLADCLSALGRSTRGDVSFSLPPSHPVAVILHRTNHSVSSRRVWNGAYIARVMNRRKFISKIHGRLEQRLRSNMVGPFTLDCDNIGFKWNGMSLEVGLPRGTVDVASVTFDSREWPKLLLGLAEPQHLRGFVSKGNVGVLAVLFPLLSPQMTELDEF